MEFSHKLTCKLEFCFPTQNGAHRIGGQTLVGANILICAGAADGQTASIQPIVISHAEVNICAILFPPSWIKKETKLHM